VLLALALFGLVGCGESSAAISKDAGRRDARALVDATTDVVDDLNDADDEGDGSYDAGVDVTGLPSIDSGGPPACHGPSDCATGSLCCYDIAAVRAPAACSTLTTCPTGQAELCGVAGGEKCKTGTCQDYECMIKFPPQDVTFFACGAPLLPTVSCEVTQPSEDAGDDSGDP
jgi:hypothetical protein